MTDRFNALTVILEKDVREDDAEPLILAIRLLKGVLAVEGHVASLDEKIAESRVRRELEMAMWKVLYPDKEKT